MREETPRIYCCVGTVTPEQQRAILTASIAFTGAGALLLEVLPDALARIFSAAAGHMPQLLTEITSGKSVAIDRLAERLIEGARVLTDMSDDLRTDGLRFPEDATEN